jgi:hypothetical protein
MSVATVALLLVTEKYLNSDYILKTELPRLLQRRQQRALKVFWVAVEDVPAYSIKFAKLDVIAVAWDRPLIHLRPTERKKAISKICDLLIRSVLSGVTDQGKEAFRDQLKVDLGTTDNGPRGSSVDARGRGVQSSMQVFFSYAREDREFALKLASDLRNAEILLWIDQLDIPPGAHWDSEVEAALGRCEAFLVILSPRSMRSRNVLDEVNYALEKGKTIFPVLQQPCDLPFRLKRIQYIDFTTNYKAGLSVCLRHLTSTIKRERKSR